MPEQLLICTDLDRTLIPNGVQPESPQARNYFAALVARPEITLAYVSGRDRNLVEEAIKAYQLPIPDFVIADVGTTIYRVGPDLEWQHQTAWEQEIAQDWGLKQAKDLRRLLDGLIGLELQEATKQNNFKLSYYVSLESDLEMLSTAIEQLLVSTGIKFRLIWSTDEQKAIGLLDILPERASKYHAIRALMNQQGFLLANTVFCGDSGNDIDVLASPIPAVLVANSADDVRNLACQLAEKQGNSEQLYIAQGGFLGMNGNYSGGMLEGIAFYHPDCIDMLQFIVQDLGYEK